VREFCNPDDEVVLLAVERPEARHRTGFRAGETITSPMTGSAGGIAGVVTPDVPVFAETGEQALQRQLDETKDYLEGIAAELRTKGHNVRTRVLIHDRPGEAIIEYARTMRPTFIAMLRRTHHSLSEMLFGSVAAHVVRSDVAPVLVVPARREAA
jgi:nucleotide-binding universal stress UspA family protein